MAKNKVEAVELLKKLLNAIKDGDDVQVIEMSTGKGKSVHKAKLTSEEIKAHTVEEAAGKAAARLKQLQKDLPEGHKAEAIVVGLTKGGLAAHTVDEEGNHSDLRLDDPRVQLEDVIGMLAKPGSPIAKIFSDKDPEKSDKPENCDPFKAAVIDACDDLHRVNHQMLPIIKRAHEALETYKTMAQIDEDDQLQQFTLCFEDVAKMLIHESLRLCVFMHALDAAGVPSEVKASAAVVN